MLTGRVAAFSISLITTGAFYVRYFLIIFVDPNVLQGFWQQRIHGPSITVVWQAIAIQIAMQIAGI